MSEFAIYDYVHPSKGNLMRAWTKDLQKQERARLNAKIDALEMHGDELIPGILAPSGTASIFKLKVRGQVELRPMVCKGPGLNNEEGFTFLLGAKEIQWKYEPEDAPRIAADYRIDLIEHPDRRCAHERVAHEAKK